MTSHLPGYMPYSEPPTQSELAPPVDSPPIRRGFCGFWDANERGLCHWYLDEHKRSDDGRWICPSEAA